MSASLPPPRSSYGTPEYGPYPDGAVQTYFRYSRPHIGRTTGLPEVDLELIKPSLPKDITINKWHLTK